MPAGSRIRELVTARVRDGRRHQPFHNPYLKGDLVLPELASVYLDRADQRPGMVVANDEVVQAFADIGWGWGGYWNSLKDWMHFSLSGG